MASHREAKLVALLALCSVASCSGDDVPNDPPMTTVPSIALNSYWHPGGNDLARLERVGLRVRTLDVDPRRGGSPEKPLRVIAVSPSPGTAVPQGTTVTVSVAFRKPSQCPDIVACYPEFASPD